jgi:hypothetical protein
MSAFDTLPAIPSAVVSGTTVVWTETQSLYPDPDYTIAYKFQALDTPVDGYEAFSVSGTGSGSAFTFTITAAAAPKPGIYAWQEIVTRVSPSGTAVIACGQMVVRPNMAATPTTSAAETMLAAINTAITTLTSTTKQSVSFNGQSYTNADIKSLKDERTRLQAEIRREKQRLLALSGCGGENDGNIVTIFQKQ